MAWRVWCQSLLLSDGIKSRYSFVSGLSRLSERNLRIGLDVYKRQIVGWLLEISGYVGTNATQPASAITMLQVMYLWLPFVFEICLLYTS